MPHVLGLICIYIIKALLLLILIDVLLSYWSAVRGRFSRNHPAVILLRQVVNPLYIPFQRILPASKTGGWDLSPMIVMVLLNFLSAAIYNNLR